VASFNICPKGQYFMQGVGLHLQVAHPLESLATPNLQSKRGQYNIGHGAGLQPQVAHPFESLLYPYRQGPVIKGQLYIGHGLVLHSQRGHPLSL